ncbi:MAG: class I SAM-dependent methyltransferase [Planctomycetes bacterium]|nr:class I SAM-dependent methyltransferase [Planctomycetota bacterium]
MSEGADYGQAEIMAGDAMVDILETQIAAIWPLERDLFGRYDAARVAESLVLDLGCGTGAATERLRELYPKALLRGVDLVEASLERARERCVQSPPQTEFTQGDAYALPYDDDVFSLVVCRHVLQAVDEPTRVVDEALRVLRPGGQFHFLVEDYGLIHFHPAPGVDLDRFWRDGPMRAAERTGGDLRQGRKAATLFLERGCSEVRVDYMPLDTTRDREGLRAVWRNWRTGYEAFVLEHGDLEPAFATACWDAMQAVFDAPEGHACWLIPVVSGRKGT